MGYASILVHVDPTPDAIDRVKLAGSLADKFDARLIGVASRQVTVPVYTEISAVDYRLVEEEEQQIKEDLSALEATFRKAAGARNSIEWRSTVEAPTLYLIDQARAGDLIVLGRQGSEDRMDWRYSANNGDVLMDAGRPILIAPPRCAHISHRHVLVAWKNTREARRAVWDALPFLRAAETVTVAALGEHAREEGVRDVVDYLARHGVTAIELMRKTLRGTVAEEIADIATREGCDLIVSGGYGHSRMREWIFGGVTNGLMNNAPVCCLMAH
jgi:nucleotide-binding universal stress UspA family protein